MAPRSLTNRVAAASIVQQQGLHSAHVSRKNHAGTRKRTDTTTAPGGGAKNARRGLLQWHPDEACSPAFTAGILVIHGREDLKEKKFLNAWDNHFGRSLTPRLYRRVHGGRPRCPAERRPVYICPFGVVSKIKGGYGKTTEKLEFDRSGRRHQLGRA